MFQVYVKDSVKAVELYQLAFDAKIKGVHENEDGSYMHAELDIFGQVLALSESVDATFGTNMQFCLHMGGGNEEKVKKAYEVLRDGAEINQPLGENFYSPLCFMLRDKFGVCWCMFV